MGLALLIVAILVLVTAFLVAWLRGSFTSDANPGGLIGCQGIALDTFTTDGRVSVRGEEWKASSLRGIIEKDSVIKVVGQLEGLTLIVEPTCDLIEKKTEA